ncbi:putative diacyglycerol O-acyltransferase tgs2 [Zhongshania aliphaticivorans]|uniref:diacylglycerol O-acyltransferase n=1 Tax=Zhongshania aliphaticivorans TaxID=1470434 RepID=A0A5S9NUK9_9GAMM|nr:wax ester/triacylglycerol synthase domain-containing protein [Zhongshania aliphaticivorans]CAA0094312.1 putative diacyglycerol O-acyltransferase tgs2 [Zhongshania aliphaticivorans]CAA0112397.1 putative diacyglycerol O-acyltransferase tgs2 [Zhongshania aliphaticivorans]
MAKLSVMDLAFFLTETDASPKHVGGLLMFRKPAKPVVNYVEKLVEEYAGNIDEIKAPFNQIIQFSTFSAPSWKCDVNFNINNHIFYHTIDGDDFRESLYELIGTLHSVRMNRERPMWEMHVIQGIDDQRFAIYTKLHHAYADGVTMSSWLVNSLSKSARTKSVTPIWSVLPQKRLQNTADSISIMKVMSQLGGRYGDYLKAFTGLTKLSAQLALETLNLTKNAVAVPFKANSSTPLTGQVSAGRQIATAAVDMQRVHRLRKLTRSTLNHIALTCIDGALHRYLQDCGAEIDEPITIQMPVNLRKSGDDSFGNKIGIVLVELANKTTDPYERLREIGFTLRNVRYQIDGVPPASVMAYTVLLGGVSLIGEAMKLGDVLPPLGNTLVSNVPGPPKALYLKGAKLEEMYPISALTPSNHLNITLYSYDGRLQFGLVATTAMPKLDVLSDYLHDAFDDLERAISPSLNAKAQK